MSNTFETALELPSAPVALLALTPEDEPRFVPIDHDGFTIGSDDRCDLVLAQGEFPKLHSVLHVQGQAVWIEAAQDDALIVINGEPFRRRALRNGDRLLFGEAELAVQIGADAVQAARLSVSARRHGETDLELLSAEELCDRIEQEERLVGEFDRGRSQGIAALMAALRDIVHHETETTFSHTDDALDGLVAQVRGLSDTLEERTQALSAQETHLIESASQLCEAQLRISRQLEQLIDRLDQEDSPGELRVSA